MPKLPADVFVTDGLPEITYVNVLEGGKRKELLDGLEQKNKIISISGPSKSGKTTLCEHIIDNETDFRLVKVTGDAVNNAESLWYQAVKQVLDSTGENAYDLVHSERVEALVANEAVLVIDDFHYINSEAREIICQQIKNAASSGLRIICLSVPHRGDDVVRSNNDLSGRFFTVDFEYWKNADLIQIAKLGFPECEYDVPNSFNERLAEEALRSPQIMQTLCLETCRIHNPDQGVIPENFDAEYLKRVKEETLRSYNNKTNLEKLRQGPRNGARRRIYRTRDGRELDIYKLLVEVIRQDPPFLSLSLAEIRARMSAFLESGSLDNLVDALEQYNRLIPSSRPFDWDEGRLTIIDPHFYFYLRNYQHLG